VSDDADIRTRIIARLIREAEHRTISQDGLHAREFLLWDDVIRIVQEETKKGLNCDTKKAIL
jgi:hypothetical protein